MSRLDGDFLALSAEIKARLVAELADLGKAVHVLDAADLAGVQEERQLMPAIHVIYAGQKPIEVQSGGKATVYQQTWLAVVATRNVRSVQTGAAARTEAGRLAVRALRCLSGWRAPSAAGPMTPAPAPPARFAAGAQYLPLAFTADVVVLAQR